MRNNLASDVFTLRIVFFPKDSFASNLCTVTYPCLVLCLTPVLVFRYRSTNSHTVICPSTIFTSKSKSVLTCFSNFLSDKHGFYFPSALTLSPGLRTLLLESRLVCPLLPLPLASPPQLWMVQADISQMQHEESACVLRIMPRNQHHPYFSINHRIFFSSERNSQLSQKDSKYPFLLNLVLP